MAMSAKHYRKFAMVLAEVREMGREEDGVMDPDEVLDAVAMRMEMVFHEDNPRFSVAEFRKAAGVTRS